MGGTCAHDVEWEEYTSHDDGLKAARFGLTRKDLGFRIVPIDGGFRGVPVTGDLKKRKIDEIVAVDDVLRLRSAAMEIQDIVPMSLSMALREEFLCALKRPAPQCMRPPTINEVHMVDRIIHQSVLSYITRDEGTLSEGLQWYLRQGRNHAAGGMLYSQMEDMPDRGLERLPGSSGTGGTSPANA